MINKRNISNLIRGAKPYFLLSSFWKLGHQELWLKTNHNHMYINVLFSASIKARHEAFSVYLYTSFNVANTQTFFVLGLLKQNCQEKVILHLSDTYLQLKALPVRNLFLFVCLCGSCLVRIEFSLFVLWQNILFVCLFACVTLKSWRRTASVVILM